MAIDLPTVVLTAQTETHSLPASTWGARLGQAMGALRSWETAHGSRAVAPLEAAAPKTLPLDVDRGARLLRIESGLKDARALLDLGDVTSVDRLRASLAVVYGEARAHPEDPEAFALVAESLRTLARIEALAGNTEDAASLRDRARAIDGGRLLGLSEGVEKLPEPLAAVTFTLMLEGLPENARLAIDGRRSETRAYDATSTIPMQLAPGEHHLRIALAETDVLDGPVVYAAFFVVSGASSSGAEQTMRLTIGEPEAPCSTRDLEPALRAIAADSSAKFAISCPSWARVVRVADAAIEVRLCGPTTCANKIGWVAPPKHDGNDKTPPGHGDHNDRSMWSSGWTYVAIGAAAVVAGGVAAWRLGAFDRSDTPAPVWRWEGAGGR